jgi:hypothetical protein
MANKSRTKNPFIKKSRIKPPQIKRSEQVSIFISYASEDKDLAASFEAELLQLFSYTPAVKVFRDVGIERGKNYRTVIANALNAADILLVILTDRMKPGFAYPGFEVGFFTKSLEERPKMFGGQDRRIIPVCIGAENPATLDYIQAIKISEDEVVKITEATMPPGNPAGRAIDNQNPAYVLLSSISDIVMNVLGNDIAGKNDPVSAARNRAIQAGLSTSAIRLYGVIFAYLQGRVFAQTYPERKIIIRTDMPPTVLSDGADLSSSNVELIGNSFQLFGFPDDKVWQFSWSDFVKKIPEDSRGTWVEGIRSLVASALQGSNENYHVVSTPKGDIAFRLFVSQIVTFVSKKTEIHVYIVQMIVRHYGDALTSRLLSAISVGLQFRFLFLEDKSKFRPATFNFPLSMDVSKEADAWKSAVTELLVQMDLVLREARDQHLMDTDLLDKIYGSDGGPRVQELMGIWEAARVKLYAAAQQVLTSSASEFASRQAGFREALKDLCEKTKIMNRDYTLRALQAITKEIGPLGDIDPPAVSDARSHPATGSTLAASA